MADVSVTDESAMPLMHACEYTAWPLIVRVMLSVSTLLARAGGGQYRFDDGIYHVIVDDDLDSHLGHEVHRVGRAPVDFALAACATKPAYLGHGHPTGADLVKAILHLVEFERLDDRFDTLHGLIFPRITLRGCFAQVKRW